MSDLKDDFKALKDIHTERVEKTPSRIEYAIEQFKKNDIEYVLKNSSTGHFHCYRKSDDKLFQFYAGTGKIQGYDKIRGIHALIKLLNDCLDIIDKHMKSEDNK